MCSSFRACGSLSLARAFSSRRSCWLAYVLTECNTEDTDNFELHIANYYKYFPREGQEGTPDEPGKDGEETPGGDTPGGKKVWF